MITFDCASPFLACANGQIYIDIEIKDRKKWVYRMQASADDKKYNPDPNKDDFHPLTNINGTENYGNYDLGENYQDFGIDRTKNAFEFGTMLSFAIPGSVIGVSYVFAFNVPPLEMTGTGIILVIAVVFRNMPVCVRAGIAAMNQLDPH